MGRPKLWNAAIAIKLDQAMLDRIAAAIGPDGDRAAFIREAIERELRRRERAAKPEMGI